MDRHRARAALLGLLALALVALDSGRAQAQSRGARVLIATPIDETRLVALRGNVRPEASAQNDRGRVADSVPLRHMQLLLKRPPERERALESYIAQLHDRSSPSFHRWLTPAQFAVRFGLSQQDIGVVTGWLRGHGFVVNTIYPGGTAIDFSGTAGAVRAAFHCEIHALSVAGVRHIANMSDPQIPVALAPAVAGIVSLHDFRPRALHEPRAQYTFTTNDVTYETVVPADLATIYNFNPLFAAGLSGQGQTIVVIEDTDVYSTSDWSTFRTTFGLSSYTSGTFAQIHPAPPGGSNNCTDPGVGPDGVDAEAILDAEWSSAAAPSAAIELASCADSGTTFGGLIALTNLINGSSPPAIVSISYGECEAANGATANAAYASTYEQAVTEGISVFVAAGDAGAAACDQDEDYATHGIGVNGFASTPYNVAAGGTDFGDTYAHTNGTYWSTTNGTYYQSALSYVPEIPWNDSCASELIATVEEIPTTYGSSGFCNSSTGKADFLTTVAGGGGPSGCASGAPSVSEVVGGTCAGAPKPSWQSGVPGIPDDGVRDLPDVSLFAGNGIWGHYYIVCWSDTAEGGEPCTGAPSAWYGAGGTSFVAPILAGLQALVNQSTGSSQGNPNYVYYTLAASQAASNLACDSTAGNAVASGCVFYDVSLGDMDVDCRALSRTLNDCYRPSGTYGVLSTSDSADDIAYGTAPGWDFASGIGSINAANLVGYWSSSDLALSGGGSVTAAGQLSYTLSVLDHGPQAASDVVVGTTLPSGFSLVPASGSAGCSQTGQSVTCSLGTVAAGSTVPLTIVIAPSGTQQTVSLSFTASSANADLDPADGSETIALNLPSESSQAGGDGPLPLWANAVLGLLLLAIGARRTARAQRRTT